MRPAVLEHGHRLRAKMFIRLVRLLSGQRMDAVAQMALYRPRFFGDPVLTLCSEVLRGSSYWSAAEREYLRCSPRGLMSARSVCVSTRRRLGWNPLA